MKYLLSQGAILGAAAVNDAEVRLPRVRVLAIVDRG